MDASLNIDDYVESHSDPEPELLRELNRQSHIRFLQGRMVSGHLQGRILKMITRMVNPANVLELGTFTGYSALAMAEGLLRPEARVHTIEADDELEPIITEFVGKSEFADRIVLHLGNAEDIVPALPHIWDMVFVDADKRHYLDYYEMLLPRMASGGFLIADNTLWDGKVVGEVPKGDREQTLAIRRFNDFVATDARVEKVILPVRDGMTVIRKK